MQHNQLESLLLVAAGSITLRREPNCRSDVKDSSALPSTPIVLEATELAGPWFVGCVDLEQPLFALAERCFAKAASCSCSFSSSDSLKVMVACFSFLALVAIWIPPLLSVGLRFWVKKRGNVFMPPTIRIRGVTFIVGGFHKPL